jgi:hypothetical protein
MQYSIFFSRPPKVRLALEYREASSPFEEYKLCTRMQGKNARERKFFEPGKRTFALRLPTRTSERTGDRPLASSCLEAGGVAMSRRA